LHSPHPHRTRTQGLPPRVVRVVGGVRVGCGMRVIVGGGVAERHPWGGGAGAHAVGGGLGLVRNGRLLLVRGGGLLLVEEIG
jgi:hypothetical protein